MLQLMLPGWNSLENVKSIHARLELFALFFFAILVLCDVLLHFGDDKPQIKRLITKWKLKTVSLAAFGVAILFEICAYPYSERNDELSSRQIASANERGEFANERATKAELEQEKLRSENLKLQAALETEKLARLKLEVKMAFRRLTTAQITTIASDLHPCIGQDITFIGNGGDREAVEFSKQLEDVLKQAGLSVLLKGVLTNTPSRTGILIIVNDEDVKLPCGSVLFRTLQAQKLSPQFRRIGTFIPPGQLNKGSIGVYVGAKP